MDTSKLSYELGIMLYQAYLQEINSIHRVRGYNVIENFVGLIQAVGEIEDLNMMEKGFYEELEFQATDEYGISFIDAYELLVKKIR